MINEENGHRRKCVTFKGDSINSELAKKESELVKLKVVADLNEAESFIFISALKGMTQVHAHIEGAENTIYLLRAVDRVRESLLKILADNRKEG